MTWEQWVSVAALLLALAAVAVGVVVLTRLAEARKGSAKPLSNPLRQSAGDAGPAAFVLNPIKVGDIEELKRLAREASVTAGLPEPIFFETTEADPGGGQARAAVVAGASVVAAAGGDGTVRAVADALAGGPVPMALIPAGTGNLLARNLDLPLGDLTGLVRVAVTGRDHAIDVGYLRVKDPGSAEVWHCFLVMAGLGLDAQMVAGADNQMKKRMGWFAYFVAGVRHMHSPRVKAQLTVGEAPGVNLRLRSLLFANCGRLPGGIVLFPDAEPDDGWLDVAALDTRGGVFGWASLFGKVILQGLGVRRQLPIEAGSIKFWRGREVQVHTAVPEPVQVDGDLVGHASTVDVRLEPGALSVRTR